jgi:hypothetical protein
MYACGAQEFLRYEVHIEKAENKNYYTEANDNIAPQVVGKTVKCHSYQQIYHY